MATRLLSLLTILVDGKTHSVETLVQQLNISHASICRAIKQLAAFGLKIETEHGGAYRLVRTVELLSVEKIMKTVSKEVKQHNEKVEVLFNASSTNSVLLNRLDNGEIHGDVVFSEYQAKGRGRQGKQWLAPLGSGIMLSIGWKFDITSKKTDLLSLFIGVAVARTLESIHINKLGLKWPNDIIVDNKKIGGILIEMRAETSGAINIVIGIGLNYDLPKEVKSKITQPVTDINEQLSKSVSRNEIAALLLNHVFGVLKKVQKNDYVGLLDEWRKRDCCIEKRATLILPNREIEGMVKGIDDSGLLLMSISGETKRFNAGEISLRVSQ